MNATGELFDVNVWLALAAEGHPHHAMALRAWTELERPCFCRMTHLGLMRLLCNRQIMGAQAFTPESAWAECEKLLGTGAISYLDEPSGVDAKLKALSRGATATRDFWTDAYLAAFAQCAGLRLVSFDSGFRRFKDLDCLILKAAA
ncbi:MAG TPA: TA system VapC family ribonuclease toxin [Verrucomicrobiae bacterium]|nr:TA system VapC family ribonuclease toxin [Verrucomicrobiae bacterium]